MLLNSGEEASKKDFMEINQDEKQPNNLNNQTNEKNIDESNQEIKKGINSNTVKEIVVNEASED